MITDDDIVDRVVDDMINEKADEVVAATMGFDTFGSKPGQHTRNQPHDHDAERLAGLGDDKGVNLPSIDAFHGNPNPFTLRPTAPSFHRADTHTELVNSDRNDNKTASNPAFTHFTSLYFPPSSATPLTSESITTRFAPPSCYTHHPFITYTSTGPDPPIGLITTTHPEYPVLYPAYKGAHQYYTKEPPALNQRPGDDRVVLHRGGSEGGGGEEEEEGGARNSSDGESDRVVYTVGDLRNFREGRYMKRTGTPVIMTLELGKEDLGEVGSGKRKWEGTGKE